MEVEIRFTKCLFSCLLVLLVCSTSFVDGSRVCTSTGFFHETILCDDNQYCCGAYNDGCCSSRSLNPTAMDVIGPLIFFGLIVFCCVMCCRCCCGKTTNRGVVYSPAPGTNTSSVTVNLPPQHAQQQPAPVQPMPYPTMVPYPQQTPYPPQLPTNPYFGMPPPAYGMPVEGGIQHASAPTAPYPVG